MKKEDIAVFQVIKESCCEVCGSKIESGSMLRVMEKKAHCLKCAGMDGLVFLPYGNLALTVRAKKLSSMWAVVVRWSRARKRYERQGLLVYEKAVSGAEKMCEDDKEERTQARKKSAKYAQKADINYIKSFGMAILGQYPSCGEPIAVTIAAHACRKYSGRVGRSAAAKNMETKAITLAVRAFIRHNLTGYEKLFSKGYNKAEARKEISALVDKTELEWRKGML